MRGIARHRQAAARGHAVTTRGLIIDRGWRYDLEIAVADLLLFRGQLRALRQRAIALAGLHPGQQVLDVGCGTGTLALDVAARVGVRGHVAGVDPGPRQVAHARSKAARRNVAIDFQVGTIEQLPFPDQTFELVFATLMLHHLPSPLQRQGLSEIARVSKPGGGVVLADFANRSDRRGLAARFHAGGSSGPALTALVTEAGFGELVTDTLQPARFSAFPGAHIVRGTRT
jgi:ubiquinone/menaquinone biosynthesis C-methylase UbiE